ncbi:hypothetical protein HK105_209395 [Polyrhizophydium stewartii]|uniref:PQ loop repeat protein n=1 Tax=Polyrhizophydium stewartii TaxID=2732419 RepID=A0ABR4MV48_9FUNG
MRAAAGDGCPVAHSAAKVVLGALISIGLFVSYAPQVRKIIERRSSAGLSVLFLLLGSLGCFSTVGNVFLLQLNSLWSLGYCLEDTLGLTQVSMQLVGFMSIVALFYLYYPVMSISDVSVDAGDLEAVDVLRTSWRWRRIQGIGALIVLYGVFVAASVVVVLQIPDQDLFERVRIGWAGTLGMIAAATGVVQFVPQIVHTWRARSPGALSLPMLMMQCPGSYVFAISLALQPGTNWTSWVSFLVGGTLQLVLVLMCLYFGASGAARSGSRSSLVGIDTDDEDAGGTGAGAADIDDAVRSGLAATRAGASGSRSSLRLSETSLGGGGGGGARAAGYDGDADSDGETDHGEGADEQRPLLARE